MWRVGVISYWTFTNGENITRVAQDYAGQCSMADAAGTSAEELLPEENIALIEALVSDDLLTAMQADPEIIEIIFEEEIIEDGNG